MAKKILLVEDDEQIGLLLCGLFAGEYVVSLAKNGEEALAELERSSYDLVITDHQMPRLSGGQMALQIRKSRPQLPIVMVSGRHAGELQSYLDLGIIDGIVRKPFSIDELSSVARNLLMAHQQNAALRVARA